MKKREKEENEENLEIGGDWKKKSKKSVRDVQALKWNFKEEQELNRASIEVRQWTSTTVTEGGRSIHACTGLCHRCHNFT